MDNFQKADQQDALKIWNDLALGNSEDATIAHNPALFSFFLDYLKLKPVYLLLLKEKETVGILPLVKTGKKFISVPHFSEGGICWKKGYGFASNESDLLTGLIEIISANNIDNGFYSIDLSGLQIQSENNPLPVEVRSAKAFFGHSSTEKVIHYINLKNTEEEQFKTFNSNLRRKINKAEKNGIKVKVGKTKLVDDFAVVYNKNMHHIGSPTLGKKFFLSLIETGGINAEILVAYLGNKPVGGAFNMWYNGYCENTWFSTLQQYNNLYPSYLLHWEMIRKAISRGNKIYSLGRSTKDSGVHQYKLQWPVEEKELYFSNTIASGFSLKNQKWLTKAWKILPGFFVDAVGPYVAKRIY